MPEVAVDVWYKVGRATRGRATGFAHLFEHMMFQGRSTSARTSTSRYLQKAGASDVNGSTSHDRTNYFEVVPTNQLELALWLESDRMGFLLDRQLSRRPSTTSATWCKNERRQRDENRPTGLVSKVLLEALYPPDHPYHHQVIGSMEDLTAASRRRREGVLPHLLRPGQRHLSSPATSIAPRPRSWWSSTSARSRPAARIRAAPPPDGGWRPPSGSPWRRRSSSRSSMSPIRRRRTSPPAIASSTCWPTCWAVASRRGCTSGWSTSSRSPSR